MLRRPPRSPPFPYTASSDLEHGLPGRLEPLAAAAGTSNRMLIYHFGTRAALLRQILRAARQPPARAARSPTPPRPRPSVRQRPRGPRRRQVAACPAPPRPRPAEPYPVTLRSAWTAMSGPQGRPYLQMFSPLHDAAGEPLRRRFRRSAAP